MKCNGCKYYNPKFYYQLKYIDGCDWHLKPLRMIKRKFTCFKYEKAKGYVPKIKKLKRASLSKKVVKYLSKRGYVSKETIIKELCSWSQFTTSRYYLERKGIKIKIYVKL